MCDDVLMTAKEAAEYLHSTENCLRSLRSEGKSPPFHKHGWRIYYKRSELDAHHAASRPSRRRQRMNFAIAEKNRAAPDPISVRP